MSFPHRKQFPSSSTVHSTETMFLPRLQRDPRPSAYNVQTTVLPMDMYVHISAYIIYFCSILSAYHLMWSRLQSCGYICHYTVTFVFTVNTERNRHRKLVQTGFVFWSVSSSKNVGFILLLCCCLVCYAVMRITSIRFAFHMWDIYKIHFFVGSQIGNYFETGLGVEKVSVCGDKCKFVLVSKTYSRLALD